MFQACSRDAAAPDLHCQECGCVAVVQIKQFLQSRVVFAVAIKARMTQLLREKGHKF